MGLFTKATQNAVKDGVTYLLGTVIPIVTDEVQKILPELSANIKTRLDEAGKKKRGRRRH